MTCNREHLRHVTFIVLLSTRSRTNINCCRKSTRASGKQRIFYVISIEFGFFTIELGISSPPHPTENHLSNLAVCFHLLIRPFVPFVPFVFVGATTKPKMNANKFRENEIGERSHCAVFLFFLILFSFADYLRVWMTAAIEHCCTHCYCLWWYRLFELMNGWSPRLRVNCLELFRIDCLLRDTIVVDWR